MKRITTLTLLALLGAAGPALAQPHGMDSHAATAGDHTSLHMADGEVRKVDK